MIGPELNNPTVMLMAGLSSLALSVWPFTIQRGHSRLVQGLNAWSLSLLAQGAAWSAWALTFLKYSEPVQSVVIGGNILLMLGCLLQLWAFSRLLAMDLRWWPRLGYSALAVSLVFYTGTKAQGFAGQCLVVSLFKAIVFAESAILLFRSNEGRGKNAARLLAYAFLLSSVYMLVRGAVMLPYVGQVNTQPEGRDFFQNFISYFSFLMAIFFTAGFITLCTQLYIHRFLDSEYRIEASSKLLNFALDSTVDAVWDYDFKTGRVFFAKRWEKMLGFEAGEIPEDLESWESRIHPEDLAAMNNAISRFAAGQTESYEMTQRIRGKHGEYVWIKDRGIIVSRDAAGNPTRMVGTMKNIDTEIRQREDLRRAQIKYRTIFEALPIGVVIFNENYAVQESNPALRAQAELSEAELAKGIYGDLAFFDTEGKPIPHEQLPPVIAVREKRAVRDVIIGRLREGLPRWYHASVEPMPGLDLFAGIVTDVTDVIGAQWSLRRFNQLLEDKVHQRTVELEAVNAELEAFSYSISHDLKAPLTRIEGWANALSEDFRNRLGEKAVIYITHIRAELRRMNAMIAAAINLAKASSVPLAPEVCDMSAIAESTAAELRREFPDNTITADISAEMKVIADPVLLEVAIRNIMQNAVKFSARSPLIRIEFGSRPDGEGRKEFFLRDEGAGFDMRYADKLFAPFQRMHRESDFTGTGIGLATVKRILHRHGGQIRAESEPDKGTTIYFTLPDRLSVLE